MKATVKWTMFRSAAAMQMEHKEHTIEELVEVLKSATGYETKSACPWIKLAIFGNMRSAKNSLRNNANVMAITGVEGDYDGGVITPDQAVEMLEKYQIKAIVYTSPSHTPEKPRWRVLAPCSKTMAPSQRSALLARVNGALGGILADESFTLSQSYFFGGVAGSEYRVMVTYGDPEDGEFVDDLDELDNIAIKKAAKLHAGDDANSPQEAVLADYSLNMFDRVVGQLGRKLRTGDNRREMLKSYTASRSNRGLTRDELVSMIEGVVSKYFDPADPIDQLNIMEIINEFARKDIAAGKVDQPVDLSEFLASISKKAEKAAEPENAAQPVEVASAVAEVEAAPVRRVRRATSSEHVLESYPPPYEGIMSEIVKGANECAYKPQPLLTMLGATIGMASCINGEYSTQGGGRFNLFALGSLESGGGKDNPRMIAETVAGMGGAAVLGRPASGAGLEDSLESKKNVMVSIDEVAHVLSAMNEDRAPAHIKDIGATILKLWSASRGTYNKRVLAKGQNGKSHDMPTICNPVMSVLGFATPSGLADSFHEDDLVNGLLGRMLYAEGDKDVEARRVKTGFSVPNSLESILKEFQPISPLAFISPVAARGTRVVECAYGVDDVLDVLIKDVNTNRANKSHPLSGSLYARSYEKIERLAGVLAIFEDPTAPVMKSRHIEWARQMVLASDSHLLRFVRENMHSNDVTRDAAKLRALLRRILRGEYTYQREIEKEAVESGTGAVARSQLLRVSKMDKRTFDTVLAHMQDLDELTAFMANGKHMAVLQGINLQDE